MVGKETIYAGNVNSYFQIIGKIIKKSVDIDTSVKKKC